MQSIKKVKRAKGSGLKVRLMGATHPTRLFGASNLVCVPRIPWCVSPEFQNSLPKIPESDVRKTQLLPCFSANLVTKLYLGENMVFKTLSALLFSILLSLTSSAALASYDTYLMVVHGCDTSSLDCSDPMNHTSHLLESSDGTTWTDTTLSGPGSVPDLIRKDGTFYIYNPGMVAALLASDGSFVFSSPVSVTDSTGVPVDFVDPSLFYDATSGLLVMFYLDSTGGTGDPAGCPDTNGDGIHNDSCTKYFRSATEVSGSLGTQFIQDSGDRVSITIGTSDPVAQTASDPDIFYDGTQYVMLVSRGANTQVFTSSSLNGTYSPVGGLSDSVLVWGGGVASGHYDSASSQYWIYVHDSWSVSVVRKATTTTLGSALYNTDFTTVIHGGTVGENPMDYLMASPGFAENK